MRELTQLFSVEVMLPTGKRLCHAHVMPGGFPPSKRSITKVTPKSCLSLFPHLNACATDSNYTRNNGLNQALLW